ncbi:leucine-rich repeat-containing protein [Planoprotostelium fungivorum]|uniref:Leucine-rich repeat-containing protein n=1 Tax=Planoprotostelium fungivorum TaxID=1890364 RepID=A0A2P6NI38_9EUKA|nr:leucine-rich repeat-containing protein [Planoprotostelium fungivorum]
MSEISAAEQRAIQQILSQRQDESTWEGYVEKQMDKKTEKRIVVIGQDRIYSLAPGGKLAREATYYDLTELKSSNPKDVQLTFKDFVLNFVHERGEDIIHMIRIHHRNAFGGSPNAPKFKLELTPSSRVRELDAYQEQPLGGFLNAYHTMSISNNDNRHRGDIAWDLENLFSPRRLTDFNLKEFEQPITSQELRPLLAALQVNTYFRSFKVKKIQLDKADIITIVELLKYNTAIEQVVLQRNNINAAAVAAICDGMAANKSLQLTRLSLDDNPLEDKGMTSVSTYLAGINRGLVHLSLARCNAGKVGSVALGNALKKNVHMSTTMSIFDVSGNKFEADGSSAVASFLASANGLTKLNLANCFINPEVILNAIMRGCPELKYLDLSGNKLTKKDVTVLAKYLQSATQLVELNLNNTSIPPENIQEVIQSISNNPYLKDFKLIMGENKLGIAGARAIATMVDKIQHVYSLDLHDNEFGEEGVTVLIGGLINNRCIKHLNIDANFKTRAKEKSKGFIEPLIALIGSETALESLSIAGGLKSELRTDVLPLIYALATNNTLKSIDISGHLMGNKGAAALGKALQTNETLDTLRWDGNATTAVGFSSFLIGLKRNFTLKSMVVPIYDIGNALKGAEVQDITRSVSEMEKLMIRNQSPVSQYLSNESAGASSQFAFLLSNKIKASGRKVNNEEYGSKMKEINQSDQLMASLFNLKEESNQLFEMELKNKLIEFVKSCVPLFSSVKSSLIENMAANINKESKVLDKNSVKRLENSLQYGGKDLPEEEFQRILTGQAHTELCQKANTALHSTVSITSDYLYEKYLNVLQEVDYDIAQSIKSEEASLPTPTATPPITPRDSKPPAKPLPTPAKKSAPPPTPSRVGRPDSAAAAAPAGPIVSVEKIPKTESNLEHLAKGKPTGPAGKKPPTRKPRPAPPASSTIVTYGIGQYDHHRVDFEQQSPSTFPCDFGVCERESCKQLRGFISARGGWIHKCTILVHRNKKISKLTEAATRLFASDLNRPQCSSNPLDVPPQDDVEGLCEQMKNKIWGGAPWTEDAEELLALIEQQGFRNVLQFDAQSTVFSLSGRDGTFKPKFGPSSELSLVVLSLKGNNYGSSTTDIRFGGNRGARMSGSDLLSMTTTCIDGTYATKIYRPNTNFCILVLSNYHWVEDHREIKRKRPTCIPPPRRRQKMKVISSLPFNQEERDLVLTYCQDRANERELDLRDPLDEPGSIELTFVVTYADLSRMNDFVLHLVEMIGQGAPLYLTQVAYIQEVREKIGNLSIPIVSTVNLLKIIMISLQLFHILYLSGFTTTLPRTRLLYDRTDNILRTITCLIFFSASIWQMVYTHRPSMTVYYFVATLLIGRINLLELIYLAFTIYWIGAEYLWNNSKTVAVYAGNTSKMTTLVGDREFCHKIKGEEGVLTPY